MKFKFINKNRINSLPRAVGVYAFVGPSQSSKKKFLYIGKTVNIKSRIKNHFQQPIFKDSIFIPLTDKIGYLKTDSEIEALLLEAELIKKHQPKYNVQWKDNKNYFFAAISKEEFSRVFITHQPELKTKLQTKNYPGTTRYGASKLQTEHIGPFVDGRALKQTLRLLRKIFPYRTCRTLPKKSCLYHQLKLCPAPCFDNLKSTTKNLNLKKIQKENNQNIKNLKQVLLGKKKQVLKNLKKEMRASGAKQDYEKAGDLRNKIVSLENVFQHSRILEEKEGVKLFPLRKEFNSFQELEKILGMKKKIKRIEGYDVSNIQGKEAVGSMVVFEQGRPAKEKYRKFKIKLKQTPDDTAMLKEVLNRRLSHSEWPWPEVMLIDGGKAQLNAALTAKCQMSKFKCQIINSKKIKIAALAKKKNELFVENKKQPVLLKNLPLSLANLFLQIRDEAHRFALSYHRSLRSKALFSAKN